MNDNGLITIDSNGTTPETVARLVQAIEKTGMTILARVDHAAAARAANLSLRPTEVFIFGNPRAGTPLMQLDQRVGIDLPIKVLVWEDVQGKTKVSYNTISWIASRHHLEPSTEAIVKAMTAAIEKVVTEAAGLCKQTRSFEGRSQPFVFAAPFLRWLRLDQRIAFLLQA